MNVVVVKTNNLHFTWFSISSVSVRHTHVCWLMLASAEHVSMCANATQQGNLSVVEGHEISKQTFEPCDFEQTSSQIQSLTM